MGGPGAASALFWEVHLRDAPQLMEEGDSGRLGAGETHPAEASGRV